ncbi:MAG: VOC family protein [Gemmataceae bacterium]
MKFAHFTLATRELPKTREFLAKTLGCKIIERPNNIPYPAAWLEIGPGQEIHLLELPDFEPSPFEGEYGRHIALTYPKNELDALKKRLNEAGVELITPHRETPFERFFFQDHNGYVFEIVEE